MNAPKLAETRKAYRRGNGGAAERTENLGEEVTGAGGGEVSSIDG